mmetsp:Transcript_7255/g.18593  ORF Transcript_7255/g.18593 Transcript_7255/m.18593 type:complete len:105 (+) Transcript_7255:323-637(+)
MSQYLGSYVVPNTSILCVVSELMDCSAADLVSASQGTAHLSECATAEAMQVVLAVLHQLHERKIVHGDVKASNVLFNLTNGVVKVTTKQRSNQASNQPNKQTSK